jgi:predicted metalloprotease
MSRHTTWRVAAWAIAALMIPLTGCSDGEAEGEARAAVDRITEVVRDAVEEAKERRQESSGRQGGQESRDRDIGTQARESFDYAAYQDTLATTFGLLEAFWEGTLPQLGGQYSDPSRYLYYRSDEGGGPRCGRAPAPARNAFYCPAGDFIAWDESGLMIPYYVQGGDFAASFVLAHEFGHAMQTRLPRLERTGLLRELQADCYAGAWAAWVADRGLLAAGDLDEATLAVFSARDVPGTPWNDPRAHGSGFERTRAFGDGFEAGAAACYPAPAEDWVLDNR